MADTGIFVRVFGVWFSTGFLSLHTLFGHGVDVESQRVLARLILRRLPGCSSSSRSVSPQAGRNRFVMLRRRSGRRKSLRMILGAVYPLSRVRS